MIPGCASPGMDDRAASALSTANYGAARVRLQKDLTEDRSDRDYILSRERLLIATLADGQPAAAEEISNQTFQLLRTQGLNADRTVASVVFNEGVKIWKGEPFEQAFAYSYIAIQKAMRDDWGNARAAAQSSLFLLKDFGDNERTGRKLTNLEIAQRAQQQETRGGGAGDKYLDKGYTPLKTDFALGYILTGLASKALGRDDEANDNFNEAAKVNAGLAPLRDTLMGDSYNAVFIVDFGRGPAKVAYGPSNSLAQFRACTPSDARGLSASVIAPGDSLAPGAGPTTGGTTVAAATDVNAMAASHFWNNMEDVRQAKNLIGDGLLIGGLVVANTNRKKEGAIVGLSAIAAGLLVKATAAADTRHLELLPQRVFVVPVNITAPNSSVVLELTGDPSSRLVLPAMSPPDSPDKFMVRYVKMGTGREWGGGEPWAAGQIVYANDECEARIPGDDLPYILGGHCVRRPSSETMEHYQSAGNLVGMTSSDLENIYREEGIAFTVEDQYGKDSLGSARKHILEGGNSLVCPLPGTSGYNRLFCQSHPLYQPKSEALKQLIAREPNAQHRALEAAPEDNQATGKKKRRSWW
jgi:hypothetical protein